MPHNKSADVGLPYQACAREANSVVTAGTRLPLGGVGSVLVSHSGGFGDLRIHIIFV